MHSKGRIDTGGAGGKVWVGKARTGAKKGDAPGGPDVQGRGAGAVLLQVRCSTRAGASVAVLLGQMHHKGQRQQERTGADAGEKIRAGYRGTGGAGRV
jgi:hypothetical protein